MGTGLGSENQDFKIESTTQQGWDRLKRVGIFPHFARKLTPKRRIKHQNGSQEEHTWSSPGQSLKGKYSHGKILNHQVLVFLFFLLSIWKFFKKKIKMMFW
jgi:hypothetical protein